MGMVCGITACDPRPECSFCLPKFGTVDGVPPIPTVVVTPCLVQFSLLRTSPSTAPCHACLRCGSHWKSTRRRSVRSHTCLLVLLPVVLDLTGGAVSCRPASESSHCHLWGFLFLSALQSLREGLDHWVGEPLLRCKALNIFLVWIQ